MQAVKSSTSCNTDVPGTAVQCSTGLFTMGTTQHVHTACSCIFKSDLLYCTPCEEAMGAWALDARHAIQQCLVTHPSVACCMLFWYAARSAGDVCCDDSILIRKVSRPFRCHNQTKLLIQLICTHNLARGASRDDKLFPVLLGQQLCKHGKTNIL